MFNISMLIKRSRSMFCIAGGTGSGISKIVPMHPIRFRYLFLLSITICGTFLLLSNNMSKPYIDKDILISWPTREHHGSDNLSDFLYTIKTDGCSIPALKTLGDEVRELVEFPKNIQACPLSGVSLLANNNTHIWIKNENRILYKLSSDEILNCCYKSFYRPLSIDDITSPDVDKRVKYNTCINFTESIEATDEFVRVNCSVGEVQLYRQYFIFAPKKKMSVKLKKKVKKQTSYNVIILGIDGVSRLNFHRTMPNTLSFLKEKGAVELLGYNKVGDNSFPNLIPMLTGLSDQELKFTCTPNMKSTFDNCPFIWDWFKEAGYYTALGEDSSSLGTFNYQKLGFIGSPTDYYMHTFIREAEKNAGVNKDFNSFLCMNDKFFYKVLLDYIENLTTVLNSSKLFGFFWEVTMSHDYLNYPMVMDYDYLNFLKRLDLVNYWDKTILILISDHGIRFGPMRSTNQGRLEERLPSAYILTPPEFRQKYKHAYDNLQLNSKRLTTPYDLHATLYDLVKLENIENSMITARSNRSQNCHNKGKSLFLPISLHRTCAQAHIDDHWCSCYKGRKMSNTNILSMNVAEQLVRQINHLIHKYSQCAVLKLAELLDITEMDVHVHDKILWQEYMAVVRTTPGNAMFEGTLRFTSNDWSLAGTVSRINLYGNQSHCISEPNLKLYCFCQ